MIEVKYPALFESADGSSNDAQRGYFLIVLSQYILLFIAALFLTFLSDQYFIYCLLVLVSAALIIYSSVSKPESDWYQCRALAESTKTLSWRFMMRAEPFTVEHHDARSLFLRYLRGLLEANRHVGESISGRQSIGDQVTPEMSTIRELDLAHRMKIYRDNRIREQRRWYASKAKSHKRRLRFWTISCVIVHGLAVLFVLFPLSFPGRLTTSPAEPLLVLASCMIGWAQLKRYSETAAAYTLAAHEIGLLESNIEAIGTESQLSHFVNEAEFAFSREHTQWIVRTSAI